MNVIEFNGFRKLNEFKKTKKSSDSKKNHAQLLKEAFVALEKYNVPQIYKNNN